MKKILFSAMVLAAAVGCNKTQVVGENTTPGVAIQLGSSMEGVTASKAAYSGDVELKNIQFLRKDDVANDLPTSFAGVLPFVGDRAVGGVISFRTTQLYDETAAPNDKYSFFTAYFPVGALASDVVTWVIDGKTDVMTAAPVAVGKKSAPVAAELTLKHELAQIEVICKAASTSTLIQTRWGKIQSIKVSNTPTTVAYDLTTLKATASVTLGNLTMVKPGYEDAFEPIEVPGNTNALVNAVAMMVPMNSRTFNLEVVTAVGGTKIVTVDLGAGNKIERAKKHQVTLTFHPTTVGDPITVSVGEIENWDAGAKGAADVK